MRLVTVAHGTRSTDGNRVAAEITRLTGRRLGLPAVAFYLGFGRPLFADAVGAIGPDTVVVPLLLSHGTHVRVDLPAAVRHADPRTLVSSPLGPDPLLARAMADRLHAAGARPGRPVVLVAAGSTDPSAMPDIARAADLLRAVWGGPVRWATLSGAGPGLADTARPGDAVAPYLLAPGFFATRTDTLARAAGVAVVADVIGAHPRVVDLVVRRVSDAAVRRAALLSPAPDRRTPAR
jgi:sirohydrochlorin ferrochelatase